MIRQLSNFICVMLLCSGLIYSCADETVQPGDETETRLDEDMVDRISEHLHLFNATRIPGDAPSGPSIHSLKISFQDTLYLIDTLPRPVKFLHTNPAENVGGVYIQVFVGGDGGIIRASHHYDVPELESEADSDTVSVVMIGIDQTDLPLPLHCRIFMIPHKDDGTPIAEAIKEVVVQEEQEEVPSGNFAGDCGLVLSPEQSWYWQLTVAYSGHPEFMYFPGTVFGTGGQNIQGCCVDGESDSGPTCLTAEPETKRVMHFATSYSIGSESFKFFDNGTFARSTLENTANPAPDLSNFCDTIPVVKDFVGLRAYNGKWKVINAPEFHGDTQFLTFSDIASTGTGAGFGNRGGYIRQLKCWGDGTRTLILVDRDLEGGPETYRSYTAIDDARVFAHWYDF